MAIRIKTNSPSQDPVIDKNSGKQDSKFFNHNQEQDSQVFPLGSYSNDSNPCRVGSLASSPDYSSSDNRTFFNTSKVEQWVANSVSGSDSFVQLAPYDQPGLLTGNHPSLSGAGAEVPETFSISHSTLSHVSLQHSAQFVAPDGPLISYNEPCTVTVAEPCPEISPGFEPEDSDILRDLWPYQTPLDGDSFFSNTVAVHASIGNEDFGLCSGWTPAPVEDFLHAPVPGASRTGGWASLLVVDPSESSYSQSSMLVPQPNTPLSPATHDDGWCATQRVIPEDEFRAYPQLSLREHVQLPSPSLYSEGTLDMSNLKSHAPPSKSQSRSETWPNYHSAKTVPTQRRPIEGEMAPREHKFYHVGPGENGLYYCPYAGTDDCSHKPEKLKCNYDKHLDSHLKPYRCKVSSCIEVRFSSTACLLRHEREAHGMHGHGDKPHLCHFPDCERSTPGNGFPRRWNLRDHMKRVHYYTVGSSSTGSSSPTPSSDSSLYRGIPAKRRASSASQAERPKRTKASCYTKPVAQKCISSVKLVPSAKQSTKASKKKIAPASQGKQRETMDKEWQEKKAAMKAALDNLAPNDVQASLKINADCEELRTIAMRIRHHEASQASLKTNADCEEFRTIAMKIRHHEASQSVS